MQNDDDVVDAKVPERLSDIKSVATWTQVAMLDNGGRPISLAAVSALWGDAKCGGEGVTRGAVTLDMAEEMFICCVETLT